MPWWAWVLIWSGLSIGLLVMLALFAIMLFRKLMTLVAALGELGDRVGGGEVGINDAGTDNSGTDNSGTDGAVPSTRDVAAVFQNRHGLAAVVADQRFVRLHRRQLRRDRAIHHGKLSGTSSVIPKDSPHAQ
jgi:hypothetical protein